MSVSLIGLIWLKAVTHLIDDGYVTLVRGNVKAALAGPKATFLVRPYFAVSRRVGKIVNLCTAKIANLELLVTKA